MVPYGNMAGNSGVVAYETGADWIKVQFVHHHQPYTYTHTSAGAKHIRQMKLLAKQGRGLSTYISRFVKDGYEK